MEPRGIKISDKREHVLQPSLLDLLSELEDGKEFHWCILFIDGVLNPNSGHSIFEYEERFNNPQNGRIIVWDELFRVASSFFQLYEVVVLGDKDRGVLHYYENDEDMYDSCEYVLDLFDCSFWEVYSKNPKYLELLQKRFSEVEVLA